MAKKDRSFPFSRSAKSLQENVTRSAPAAGASYTLVGAIILLGGIGYALDQWLGTDALVPARRAAAGHGRRVLRAGEDGLAEMRPAVLDGWGAAVAVVARRHARSRGRACIPESLLGMLGPLVSAVATWVVVARTYAAAPERLTGVLVTAFALKVVFFGAYVAVMLRVLALRPVPFVRQLHRLFHRAVRDGGAVPAAPVATDPR